MSDPWETEVLQPSIPPRRFSAGAIAALATAVLVLAVAGLAIGWYVAGGDPVNRANPQNSASATELAPPSPTPSVEPTLATPSATPTVATGQLLPNLVGLVFKDAWKQARALRLNVSLKFGQPGDGSLNVLKTEPAANAPIRPGDPLKIYVSAPPPEFDMIDVVGRPCETAKNELLAAGLLIGRYLDRKRDGVVTATDPAPGDKVKWNGSVLVTCKLVSATASATPAP